MQTPSRIVSSRQTAPHPELARLIERHCRHSYRRPFRPASTAAFEAAARWLRRQNRPLILDAGCGTGASTRHLAMTCPGCAVIGVDKSVHRLNRQSDQQPDNCLLLRADLIDFWRLAVRAGWQPRRHYLLYPNPWPKPKHLARRWHAHPIMPWIIALGGHIELRTNWRVYAEEFARCLEQMLRRTIVMHSLAAPTSVSPFERKYRESGHALYACSAGITPAERHYWSQITSRLAANSQLATLNQPAGQYSRAEAIA